MGASAARRRSLLASELSLEWTVSIPAALAARAQNSTVRVVQQQVPAAMQGRGFAVTAASAVVMGSGPSIAQVAVYDYETGEAFTDASRPVILLAGASTLTVWLPLVGGLAGFVDPGWTAMDNMDGDITPRCRRKYLNRTEDMLDVTKPGKPLVWRCVPPTRPPEGVAAFHHITASVSAQRSVM